MRARLTYPGVTCEACRDIEEVDGVRPDCENGGECIIPPAPAEASRAVEAWKLLDGLRQFQVGGVILETAKLTPFELGLVGLIEREIRAARQEE